VGNQDGGRDRKFKNLAPSLWANRRHWPPPIQSPHQQLRETRVTALVRAHGPF
jgi:hypothetical protein